MRILKLDGLRGIFSLMIVFLHYPKDYIPDWFHSLFFIRESYIFVDFFFVLSGFVISYNYNWIKTKEDIIQYLKKRFFRIYPLMFFSAVIFLAYVIFSKLVIGSIYPNLFEEINVTWDNHYRPFLDAILLTNSTPILGIPWGINNPSWSISAEMISYLIFAIIMFFFRKKIHHYIFLMMIVFSSIFLFYNNIFFASGEFGFIRGILSFSSGFYVWRFFNKRIKVPNVLEIFLLFILIIILYLINYFGKFTNAGHFIMSFILPVFFSLFILIYTKTNGLISKILESSFFQFLGKISYSVYLNHAVILIIVIKPAYRVFNITPTSFNQMMILFLVVLVTIIYSLFTYNYIEVKMKKYLMKKFFK
jgi:peptidoglycan/LPS O-acetylase OafA/YrhL